VQHGDNVHEIIDDPIDRHVRQTRNNQNTGSLDDPWPT
jgi:hypothetical protein